MLRVARNYPNVHNHLEGSVTVSVTDDEVLISHLWISDVISIKRLPSTYEVLKPSGENLKAVEFTASGRNSDLQDQNDVLLNVSCAPLKVRGGKITVPGTFDRGHQLIAQYLNGHDDQYSANAVAARNVANSKNMMILKGNPYGEPGGYNSSSISSEEAGNTRSLFTASSGQPMLFLGNPPPPPNFIPPPPPPRTVNYEEEDDPDDLPYSTFSGIDFADHRTSFEDKMTEGPYSMNTLSDNDYGAFLGTGPDFRDANNIALSKIAATGKFAFSNINSALFPINDANVDGKLHILPIVVSSTPFLNRDNILKICPRSHDEDFYTHFTIKHEIGNPIIVSNVFTRDELQMGVWLSLSRLARERGINGDIVYEIAPPYVLPQESVSQDSLGLAALAALSGFPSGPVLTGSIHYHEDKLIFGAVGRVISKIKAMFEINDFSVPPVFIGSWSDETNKFLHDVDYIGKAIDKTNQYMRSYSFIRYPKDERAVFRVYNPQDLLGVYFSGMAPWVNSIPELRKQAFINHKKREIMLSLGSFISSFKSIQHSNNAAVIEHAFSTFSELFEANSPEKAIKYYEETKELIMDGAKTLLDRGQTADSVEISKLMQPLTAAYKLFFPSAKYERQINIQSSIAPKAKSAIVDDNQRYANFVSQMKAKRQQANDEGKMGVLINGNVVASAPSKFDSYESASQWLNQGQSPHKFTIQTGVKDSKGEVLTTDVWVVDYEYAHVPTSKGTKQKGIARNSFKPTKRENFSFADFINSNK